MSLIRREPHYRLPDVRRAMESLFEDSLFGHPDTFWKEAFPPVDMFQNAKEVVVKVSVPGVRRKDLDISITGDTLTIKGETKVDEQVKREDYVYQEHRYGSFARSVVLPVAVKADKVEASLEHGVLTVTLPKSRKAVATVVKIKPRGVIEAEKIASPQPRGKKKA